jgi:hypothetical protein
MLLIAVLLVLAPAAHGGAHWRWPVQGPVAERFAAGEDPFARGQHRGIDIASPAGTRVGAACAGRVVFAGTVGTAGRTVSELTATYLHLSSIAVRSSEEVGGGERIGAVGTSGRPSTSEPHLHFGVRRSAERFGYVDPLLLLPRRAPLPPGPAPLVRRPRLPTPPAALPRKRPVPVRPGRAPVAVWVGAGLLAVAAPGLGLRARRRRRRVALQSATRSASVRC